MLLVRIGKRLRAICPLLTLFTRPPANRLLRFAAMIEPTQALPCPEAIAPSQIRRFSSCMFSARPRISLVNTSKLAGVPASSVFSPLTIDS